MLNHPHGPFKRWIRHTASVPKGLLRYHVLRLLKDKPMSGSEIMEDIEEETDGRWKPSPGSVYPLLAYLQDSGYTREVPAEEGGIRRYALTERGEKFLEEQVRLKGKLRERLEFLAPPFLAPPFFSGLWFSSHPERLSKLREPVRRFVRGLFNLKVALERNPTDQALKEVEEFLNNTAEKIEEINRKLNSADRNHHGSN